jgi:ribosomal protein S18 acetylase RimI-like enzyme
MYRVVGFETRHLERHETYENGAAVPLAAYDMNVVILPATQDRWTHLEQLFEAKGGPHYCWCMVWRNNEHAKSLPGKVGKKASMRCRVEKGVPIGLLAYMDEEPVAWCSIAPRETYKPLGGDETKNGVWSLTCFFVKREFRNRGLASRLLNASIRYAKESGARYVEAYPVDPESPSYRFMGFKPMFEKAGFEFVKTAGSRRNVMLLALS